MDTQYTETRLIVNHFTENSMWAENVRDEMKKHGMCGYRDKETYLEIGQHIMPEPFHDVWVDYNISKNNIEIGIRHHKKGQRCWTKLDENNEIKIGKEVLIKVIKQIHETLSFLEDELSKIFTKEDQANDSISH